MIPASNFDIPVDHQPQDSISCLDWNPDSKLLAASSWDSKIRIYKFIETTGLGGSSILQEQVLETPDPLLSIQFFPEQSDILLTGSIDGSVSLFDINSKVPFKIGQHEDAVKDVYSMNESSIFSLSYDKKIYFWDLRMENPAMKCEFDHKIYCSDFDNDQKRLVVGFSNEKLLVSSMPQLYEMMQYQKFNFIDSPLGAGSQLSAIAISKHDNALGVTSSDGRANISTLSQKSSGTFGLNNIVTFKCHKLDPGQGGNTSNLKILFPVHAIGFHPLKRHSFFTAGGDGSINFWDSNRKDRLKTLSFETPVTKAKLSHDGELLACALGYDWSKGIQGAYSCKTFVFVHKIQSNEYVN